MFVMHVPKFLWGEAVLTATYLINRMPSRVLNFLSPKDKLPSFFPLLSITVRSFFQNIWVCCLCLSAASFQEQIG